MQNRPGQGRGRGDPGANSNRTVSRSGIAAKNSWGPRMNPGPGAEPAVRPARAADRPAGADRAAAREALSARPRRRHSPCLTRRPDQVPNMVPGPGARVAHPDADAMYIVRRADDRLAVSHCACTPPPFAPRICSPAPRLICATRAGPHPSKPGALHDARYGRPRGAVALQSLPSNKSLTG
jgi:hypothetical protein